MKTRLDNQDQIGPMLPAITAVPASGDPALVNTTTLNDQYQSSGARLSDGRYVVVWTDDSLIDTSARSEVRGQIFAADGSKVGGEIHVNTTVPDVDYSPQVAADSSGGFVVTWIHGEDEFYPESDPFLQRFDASGNKVGPEIVANNLFASRAQAEVLSSGYTVDVSENIDYERLSLKIYNPAGGLVRGLSLDTGGATTPFDTAALTGGSLVVAYVQNVWDQDYDSVPQLHVAQIDYRGNVLRDTAIADLGSAPQIAALPGGSYVLGYTDASGEYIAQVYDSKGAAVGAAIPITDEATAVQLTALPDGRIIANWAESDATAHIQVFTQQGDRSGAEQVLHERGVTVAAADSDHYVATYTATGNEGDGSGTAIRQQLFEADHLVQGTAAAETLNGTDQGDTIYAGRGADVVNGVDGNDLIYGENDNDTVHGGAGADLVYGGFQGDTLYGDAGNDVLVGDTATLATGGGLDTLYGGDGNDTLFGDAYTLLAGGIGRNDVLVGGDGDDTLFGDARELQTGSTAGNDTLLGGAGNDVLYGDGQTIAAGVAGGNDKLDGGAGNDLLYGGGGNDQFIFAAPGFGNDTIEDFGRTVSNTDRIDLHGLGLSFGSLNVDVDAAGDVVLTSAGFGADSSITLVGVHSVTESDFVF